MIDLHCHLLPGVDDGPATLDEAVLMCRMAQAEGCEVLFATPHQRHPHWSNCDREALEPLRRELQARLGDRPRVLAGAEIRVDSELLADLDRLPASGVLPLAGSRYLLLELERRGPTVDPEELVHELSVAGWRPIVAHPEHYPWLIAQPRLAERLVELGALLQVTAMSLAGGFGRRPQVACRELLDRGLVHFVASDAHGTDFRPPGLAAAYALLAAGWGVETAVALTSGNPAAVVENRPLPRPVPA
jgi:protein-tyrosine phosphatase